MPEIYAKQKKFFRKAYETGEHGWPVTGPTPDVETLLRRIGSGRGRTAIDLGCGEGRHTILLAGLGYATTAVDYEPLALKKAREHVARPASRPTTSWAMRSISGSTTARSTWSSTTACSITS